MSGSTVLPIAFALALLAPSGAHGASARSTAPGAVASTAVSPCAMDGVCGRASRWACVTGPRSLTMGYCNLKTDSDPFAWVCALP